MQINRAIIQKKRINTAINASLEILKMKIKENEQLKRSCNDL